MDVGANNRNEVLPRPRRMNMRNILLSSTNVVLKEILSFLSIGAVGTLAQVRVVCSGGGGGGGVSRVGAMC
jgi:hypothetical protein